MLRLLLSTRGSRWHSVIQEEDYRAAREILESARIANAQDYRGSLQEMLEWLSSTAEGIDWFDPNAIVVAGDAVGEQILLLQTAYGIRQKKDGVSDEFQIFSDSKPVFTKAEIAKFRKSVERRDKLAGTGFTYGMHGMPEALVRLFAAGFQFIRLVLGPAGFVMGRIPFVAFAFQLIWIAAACIDWLLVGVPYLIWGIAQGVPFSYLDTETQFGPLVFGNSPSAKANFRAALKQTRAAPEAFSMALIAIWLEFKFLEVVRKSRQR